MQKAAHFAIRTADHKSTTESADRQIETPRRPTMQRSGRNLTLTGVAGVAIAAYGVYVEHQKRLHQSKYSALCDSKYFSCSKVVACFVAPEQLRVRVCMCVY